MKKYIICTLAVAGILTGCGNDTFQEAPAPGDNGIVPVLLSAGQPSVSVETRGGGSVGGIKESQENHWNNETVYIYSFRKAAADYSTPFIDNAAANFVKNDDNGLYDFTWKDGQTKYFNQENVYDFFGYHIDDAGDPKQPQISNSRVYFNVTLNGTQDLMIAKATLLPEQETLLLNKMGLTPGTTQATQELARAFSAHTARNGVQPVMQFNHLLSRLQFIIYPGIEGAEKMIIESVKVKSLSQGKLVVAYKADADKGLADMNTPVDFSLQEKTSANGVNNMQPLTDGKYKTVPMTDPDPKKNTPVQVGESMMITPGQSEYELTLTMKQWVVKSSGVEGWEYATYSTRIQTAKKDTFKAGFSYKVNMIIYGLQEVQVTANLDGWTQGEDIPVDPDDEF